MNNPTMPRRTVTDIIGQTPLRSRLIERAWIGTAIFFSIMITFSSVALAQLEFESPPIDYLKKQPNNPVERLNERLKSGETKLAFDKKHGYLPAILQALEIPLSSQGLVFSKTSLQQYHINPRHPRALYFNDDVYVGWVQQGEVVEISSADPELGTVYYSISQQEEERPQFMRQTDRCLLCHASSHTGHVPGHLIRSVYPQRNGRPLFSAGSFRTDYRSPFKERWGGWYVSGTHGRIRHMGNIVVNSTYRAEHLNLDEGANITDLNKLFSTKNLLTPHSDIVALMVLEHQATMHNRLTAANFSGKITTRDAQVINDALQRGEGYVSPETQRRYASAAQQVVEALLFVDETKLTDPVKGTSSFAQEFAKLGPRDKQGRSLREFDLKKRIFRYPCSYLIYSESFDALPAGVREEVYCQLYAVLSGKNKDKKFAHLSQQDRAAIREILQDTKPTLAAYWKTKCQP